MSSMPPVPQYGQQAAQPQEPAQPFSMGAFIGGGDVTGPSAEETAGGITDQLKQVLVIGNAVAEANPGLADLMKQMRQAAMQAMLQTQSQMGGGNAGQM